MMEKTNRDYNSTDVTVLWFLCFGLTASVIVCAILVHFYHASGVAVMSVFVAALSGFQLSIVARRLLTTDDTTEK